METVDNNNNSDLIPTSKDDTTNYKEAVKRIFKQVQADWLIVEIPKRTTPILLTNEAEKAAAPLEATVLAAGPGTTMMGGNFEENPIKVGEIISFPKKASICIKIRGFEFTIIPASTVLSTLHAVDDQEA